MRKARIISLFVVMILLAAMVTNALANDASNQQAFEVKLVGANEVPAVPTEAKGKAIFMLSQDGESIFYRLDVKDLYNPVASHIHLAPPGVNGPVVVGLFSGPAGVGEVDGTIATGTITAANLTGPLAGMPFSALLDAIRSGNTYVNVHTNDGIAPTNTGPGDMASGEIRGQLP